MGCGEFSHLKSRSILVSGTYGKLCPSYQLYLSEAVLAPEGPLFSALLHWQVALD